MTSPIDRALERVRHSTDPTNIQTMYEDWIVEMRAILTDLAAEIKADQYEMDLAMIHAQRDELNEVHARLDAVVEKIDEAANFIMYDHDKSALRALAEAADLARGEGGEQAVEEVPQPDPAPAMPAAPDATLDEIVREAEIRLFGNDKDVHVLSRGIVRAACIRARETDPKLAWAWQQCATKWSRENAKLRSQLAAVREWRDSFGGDLPEYVGQEAYDQLDAILDGRDDD